MIMSYIIFFISCDTAHTEIYTLSLHDALPISLTTELDDVSDTLDVDDLTDDFDDEFSEDSGDEVEEETDLTEDLSEELGTDKFLDRKSTRLNSSHVKISYAVFCLKKKIK